MYPNEIKRRDAILEQIARSDPDPSEKGPQFDVFDAWEGLGLPLGSYNGEVDADVLGVLEGILDGKFMTDIAEETGLKKSHVELIQYMLCDANICEYGTSPRGCWIVHGMKEEVQALAKRWRAIVDSWGD